MAKPNICEEFNCCLVLLQVQQLRVSATDDRHTDHEGKRLQREPTQAETTGGAGGKCFNLRVEQEASVLFLRWSRRQVF